MKSALSKYRKQEAESAPYIQCKISGNVGIRKSTDYLFDGVFEIKFAVDVKQIDQNKGYDDIKEWCKLERQNMLPLYLHNVINGDVYYTGHEIQYARFNRDSTDFSDLNNVTMRRVEYSTLAHSLLFINHDIKPENLINHWMDSQKTIIRLPSIVEYPNNPHLLNYFIFIMNYYRKVSLLFTPWDQKFYLEYESIKAQVPYDKVNEAIRKKCYLFNPEIYTRQPVQEAINRIIKALNHIFEINSKPISKPNTNKYWYNISANLT